GPAGRTGALDGREVARTGRRPGTGGTREKILGAARAHFARSGFEAATVRAIAADAQVDPALVLHYFGSKQGLFKASTDFPVDPAVFIPKLIEPGLDGLGERIVRSSSTRGTRRPAGRCLP